MKRVVDIDENLFVRLFDNGEDSEPALSKEDSIALETAVRKSEEYEERPQGEWIYREEWFEDEKLPRMAWGCNQCGVSIKSDHEKRGFCPNCGAKMKGY